MVVGAGNVVIGRKKFIADGIDVEELAAGGRDPARSPLLSPEFLKAYDQIVRTVL
tara:strand:- start:36 stop:200 length:165 start_codon:yes stop_codon:yes gene_type:complete